MISVIIPVYNEEMNISTVVKGVKRIIGEDDEILVINDGSTDKTKEIADAAGAKVISHHDNIGNGAAVKTGIRSAKGDIIVLIDGDGQHNPDDITRMVNLLERHDMVVGARTKDSEASFHRNFANRLFNIFAAYLTKKKISDLTSGFRAVKGPLAKKFVYLLPNTFSYPTTLTLSIIRSGYSVGYTPIKTFKRKGKSKINPVLDGIRFFLIMLKIATLFSPLRVFLPISLVFLLAGISNYIYTFMVYHRFTNMSAMLIINGILIFLMGLVSEQIAQLRLDRTEDEDR
ncbi:MAG: glycosyltransferase family 2 protein [Nitrospirota bacterium]